MADIPSISDLVLDSEKRKALTDAQYADVIKQMRQAIKGLGRPSMNLTPSQFAQKFSNGEWRSAKHLEHISKKLELVEQRKIKRLLISVPPRHGKSYLVDWFFPAWWLTRHPKDRIILAGYGEQFARTWGGRVRDTIIEHSDDLNLVVNKERTAADDWELNSRGGMLSVGVGGAIMGRGANLLIIDDPIKSEEEANSETYRQKMWDWWQTTAYTRLEPDGVVIGIMTRWHQDDLFGRIIDADEGGEWDIVNIPAEAEDNDCLGRAPGEWLWLDRFPEEEYEEKKRILNPWWWASLFQQRPSPAGGGLIQRDWFQWYHSLPSETEQWIQSWDLALKDKKTNDPSAGQVWARKGANCYLVDSIVGHFTMEKVIQHMIMWSRKYPRAVAKLVEDTAMGPLLKQTISHSVPGVIPVPVKGTSKRSRVENTTPFLQGHNVWLPQSENDNRPKWVLDFVEECAAYPKGTHDDQVDAFTQAIAHLQPAAFRKLRTDARAEAEMDNVLTPLQARAQAMKNLFSKSLKASVKKHNPSLQTRKMW